MSRAVLLVDHGSRRAVANEQLEEIARRLRARLSDSIVETAHMELVPPSVADGIDACVEAGASEIVVHPYFLAPGSHTTTDIPRLVREAISRHPNVSVRISPPLGAHDKLIDVILDRLEEASQA